MSDSTPKYTEFTPKPLTQTQLNRLAQIKGFLMDMDGTLYVDSHPLPGAVDWMKAVYHRPKLVNCQSHV